MEYTTTDQTRLNGIKALVYGGAGAGKTVLCSTAPSPVILSAESGLLSLRGHRIPVIVIHNRRDLEEAYRWVTESYEARQFATICIDSCSELGEIILQDERNKHKDPRKAYGEMQEVTTRILKGFRDLQGPNVYFSAKMEPLRDEMTGTVLYGPAMPGRKLGHQIPYLFDEVFHLGVTRTAEGQIYRYLQTFKDLQFDCKDRSGALQPYEAPDLSHIFNRINGGQ